MATAKDSAILEEASRLNACVVTMDSDFHGLLATSGADHPSVVRLRVQGLAARELANLLLRLAPQFASAAGAGALITIDERTVRIHSLPLNRKHTTE